MADNFITFVTEYNTHLQNMGQGIGVKYDIDYTLDDLKKIAQPLDSKNRTKGEPDLNLIKAYDFALAVKRARDQALKTPQDYYTAHIFEVSERIEINNKISLDFIGARK